MRPVVDSVIEIKLLKQIKKNDCFLRIKHNGQPTRIVYVRGDYDRSIGKYIAYRWDDINSSILLDGTSKVTQSFIF